MNVNCVWDSSSSLPPSPPLPRPPQPSSYQPAQRRLIDSASPFHAEDEIISECGEEKQRGGGGVGGGRMNEKRRGRFVCEEGEADGYSGIKTISLTTHSDFGPKTHRLYTRAQTHTYTHRIISGFSASYT